MRTKKYIVYWDSCVFISLITNGKRPNHEMDGVYDCVDKILNGQVLLIVLRDVLFEEVQLKTLEQAEKFRKLMMRQGIEMPSKDFRVEKLASELRDYYNHKGPKKLGGRDSLHLAAAIHYRANAFYTFDEGQKGDISLLSLNGNVAGYPLIVCKPPVGQYKLF
jgi:predicted nucleic acid-binding protein